MRRDRSSSPSGSRCPRRTRGTSRRVDRRSASRRCIRSIDRRAARPYDTRRSNDRTTRRRRRRRANICLPSSRSLRRARRFPRCTSPKTRNPRIARNSACEEKAPACTNTRAPRRGSRRGRVSASERHSKGRVCDLRPRDRPHGSTADTCSDRRSQFAPHASQTRSCSTCSAGSGMSGGIEPPSASPKISPVHSRTTSS